MKEVGISQVTLKTKRSWLPDQQGRIFVITIFPSEKIKRIGPVIFNGIEHKWYQGQIHVSNKCTVKNILQFNSRLIFYIKSLVFKDFFTSRRVSKSNDLHHLSKKF